MWKLSPSSRVSCSSINMSDVKKKDEDQVERVDLDNPVTEYNALSLQDAAAIEKSLVRKIDLVSVVAVSRARGLSSSTTQRILPVLLLIYILNYVSCNVDGPMTATDTCSARSEFHHPGSSLWLARGGKCQGCHVEHCDKHTECWIRR